MIQSKFQLAQIIHCITLETLLDGYQRDPIMDIDCIVPEQTQATTTIVEDITTIRKDSAVADTGYEIAGLLEKILGRSLDENLLNYVVEQVQNTHTHCCGNANLRFYATERRDRLIGMLEFNSQNGFQGDEVPNYIQSLQDVARLVKARKSGKFVANLDMGDPSFHMGTYWLLLQGKILRIGIADVNSQPYSFFEYDLNAVG